MTDTASGDLLVAPPSAEDGPIDLSRLTPDQAIGALLAGRALLPGTGTPFALGDGARKALAFYAQEARRTLWDTTKREQVREREIDDLLDALDGPLPAGWAVDLPADGTRPRWHLVSASIGQFGGLHAHCDGNGQAPPELPLSTDGDILLLIGPNGAGKSQIAKALCWGLTGQVPRTHNEPASFTTLVNRYTPPDAAAGTAGFELPTIVPIPGRSHLEGCGGTPLLATSVTLNLEDDGGRRLTLRREIRRAGDGFESAVRIVSDDGERTVGVAAALGVSELALESSALTMARLPFIRLDGPNALTRGVAELTGVAPLKRLGERAADGLARWLKEEYPKKQRNALKKFEPDFKRAATTLRSALEGVQPPLTVAIPDAPDVKDEGAAYAKALAALDAALAEREAQAKRIIKDSTGLDLEPDVIGTLLDQVRRALTVCEAEAVRQRIDSALAPWRAIAPEDAETATQLATAIAGDAHAFARIDADRQSAARLRLYATLRRWADANAPGAWPPGECPVCETPLKGLTDRTLAVEITEAMAEVDRQQAASHVDATQWERAACARLDQELSASVRQASERTGTGPAVALAQAFADGLVKAANLTGHLGGLATRLREEVAAVAAGFPPVTNPVLPGLPDALAEGSCAGRLAAVAAAIGGADWVRASDAAVAALAGLVEPQGDAGFNLFRALDEIRKILEAQQPLKIARDAANDLQGKKNQWDLPCRNIRRAKAAAGSVAELEGLAGLVDAQVDTLMKALHDRTEKLCGRFYERTNTAGPDLDRVEVVDGSLKRWARFDDVTGDGGEVLNASRDRAWLFAFAIALLERIRERDGGLSLLLLDDPQSLFDEANQRRLGAGLGSLPKDGTRPLIVTFNHHFAAALRRNAPAGSVRSFEIQPRSSRELRANVRPLATELERARRAWKQQDQDLRCVTAFCAEARRYLETALCDLLWSSRIAIDGSESLEPLFNKLENLTKRGAPYDKACFRALVKHEAWKDKTVRDAINWAHHGVPLADLKPGHAEQLEPHINAIVGLIEECQKALDKVVAAGRAPASDTPAVLPARPFASLSIPVQGALAARDGTSADDASAPEPVDDLAIDPNRFTLFACGSGLKWLTPFCRPGDVLVVEREPRTGEGLSVVWDGLTGFAGWLRRSSTSGAMFLDGNPDHSFLMEIDPERQVVHPVAGILFQAVAAAGGVVAACDEPTLMAKLKAAVPVVTGHSADPMLGVGDAALIGAPLDGWPVEGTPMAVRLPDDHVLKRLGRRLDRDGRVRLLDSLGLSGDSLPARLPGPVPEGFDTVATALEIAPVLGVWYRVAAP
ncbi:AAA family ATPase [Azospirillum lipoferum]|uniref:Rad50/SbcC-type AAA domain-containing protein n=1 Tax=Azospirillum lipoferum (strain 4B) TaxID=862719 RepID=G7Z1V5_AZOL4|nr:AAA family ATPase [Azospirillum lipoferum]CBS87294.1 protein of unknown function [Azospirillum lipoferum 4B]